MWQAMDTESGRSGRLRRKASGDTSIVPKTSDRLSVRQSAPGSSVVRGAFVVGSAAAFVACTSTSQMPPAPPVPDPTAGYVSQLPPYRIQVGDVLDVRLMLN